MLAVVLRSAEARGDCVDLPGLGRQIDLPDGYTVQASEDGHPQIVVDTVPVFTVFGPGTSSCADFVLTDGFKEQERYWLWDSRYVRPYGIYTVRQFVCIDGVGGSYHVDHFLMASSEAPDVVATRIADALTTDVQCPWETPPGVGEPAAPAYGDCVTLPVAGRQIDLPDDWALLDSGGAPGDHLQSPRFSIGLEIRFWPGGICYELEYDYVSAPGMGARYEYTGGADGVEGGCIEVPGGAWTVDKHGTNEELLDPAWLSATDAVADMIAYDVTCPWESSVGAPLYPSDHPPAAPPRVRTTLGADLSAAFVHSSLPLGSYSMDELALRIGAIVGPLWLGADLRFGGGIGSLVEGGLRLGAVFGERTRIAATFGFGGRKLDDDGALGFGVRVAVTHALPRRFVALGSIDVGWMSPTLEYTVPTPRTERGPLELEPAVLLGGGWRWLFAGFESRTLAHYDQRTYGAVLGLRYAN